MDTHRRPAPERAIQESTEKITGFDPIQMHAPFLLRCSALAIDYIVIVVVPSIGLILNKVLAGPSAQGNIVSANTVWFFAVLLGFCNVVILPSVSSQTLGMMLIGLRIVGTDGSDASVGKIIFRNTVGYLLSVLTLGAGFFIAALNRTGRALHDIVAGTVVVNATKRRRIQA